MSKSFLVEPERVKVWGQPRNDMLFEKQDAREVLQQVFGTVGTNDGYERGVPSSRRKERLGNVLREAALTEDTTLPTFKKAVLYAPTFRDNAPTKIFPFKEFDVERLQEWLEVQDIFLCIRLHLYDQTAYRWLKELDRPGSRIRLLNEDRAADIMEVLNIFDLLITDYSSIYIDYLLTGHPIVFLPYDKEEYLRDRGMNFDYDEATPGPKPKTFQEFLNSIHDLLYNHDGYVRQRAQINEFFNEIQSPCCAEICNCVRELTDRRLE